MKVGAIKTEQAQIAIDRIKKMTKREVKDFCYDVPANFIEKRNYMQSDEFLKDEHNIKMFDLAEELMEFRDKIAGEIEILNKNFKNKFVQGINGFTRLKEDVAKDFTVNFEDEPTISNNIEAQYRIIRNVQLYTESRRANF